MIEVHHEICIRSISLVLFCIGKDTKTMKTNNWNCTYIFNGKNDVYDFYFYSGFIKKNFGRFCALSKSLCQNVFGYLGLWQSSC